MVIINICLEVITDCNNNSINFQYTKKTSDFSIFSHSYLAIPGVKCIKFSCNKTVFSYIPTIDFFKNVLSETQLSFLGLRLIVKVYLYRLLEFNTYLGGWIILCRFARKVNVNY
jgi:small basic protein